MKRVRILTHIAIFALAALICVLGVGVGLQHNLTYGALLLLGATMITAANAWWLLGAILR